MISLTILMQQVQAMFLKLPLLHTHILQVIAAQPASPSSSH
jgi:hypothetical protein